MKEYSHSLLVLAFAAGAMACASAPTSPSGEAVTNAPPSPALVSIVPTQGSTSVDPTKPILLTFNMPMMAGTELLVVVHEGSLGGWQVPGSSSWSPDRRAMTFIPTTPLKPKTTYFVHLSPAIAGSNGRPMSLSSCGALGGTAVTGGMMGAATAGMMGTGWQAADGTFGMFFTFTTA